MNNADYDRLLELKQLIDNKKASPAERKEYLDILLSNGNITRQQYDSYLQNKNADDILNAALTIGGVVLASWLIMKVFEKSD